MVMRLLSILGLGTLGLLVAAGLPSCSALTPTQPQAPIMPIINNNPAGDNSGSMVLITLLVVFLIAAVIAAVAFLLMWYQSHKEKKIAVKRAESLDFVIHNLTGIPGHNFVSTSGMLMPPQLSALLRAQGELPTGKQEANT